MLMKRLLLVAVFWGAALLPVAAHGQRAMGGGRAVAPPMRGSGFGARPAPAVRFAPTPQAIPANRGFITPGFHSRVVFPHQRIVFHSHFHNRPFFPSGVCFNGGFGGPFFCGNGFFNSGFIGAGYVAAPYIGSGYPYPAEYAYTPPPQPVVVDDSNSRELSLEVERLSDQVQLMRDEQKLRDERNQQPGKPQENLPNTVIVLRNGSQLSVRNYAIIGPTMWILNESTAKKIPLSDLDLPATETANARNGIEFRLPSTQSH